ncbi:Bacterial alpha-L-rhamnosidase [Granulicella sp. WH15]|uniref:alpha-L-rhamnosidase-related protein n=1 Tax=Granulicella sp. WH15 TaxID=2602070 RepID=UPI0013669F19|nr:alpha-L-rhamnosidase C-terminal domain-containing protein [Granulicella sp. WH15]QHN03002.1 Bacterial alpha-L-rhamnosidase [Granulicella sp. WH15]
MSVLGKGGRERKRRSLAAPALLCCVAFAASAAAQSLDPARDRTSLHMPPATTLREQFIWTKNDAAALDPAYQAKVRGQDDKTAPHYFRTHFRVDTLPQQATLYIAGPRSATVFLNGTKVLEFADAGLGKGFHVMHAEVAAALHPGENVLAIEEVRGHSSLHTGAGPVINQVTYGEVLAAKIVPAGIAADAPPLLISDASWRSSLEAHGEWSAPLFDDSGWPLVQSLGPLGSRSDFLQWNADAGLYEWPGYAGIGPAMRTFDASVTSVRDVVQPESLAHTDGLLSRGEFTVSPSATAPALTLDFGKEISGRLRLVSSSDVPVTVETSYGESAEEAMGHAYLGVRSVTVPPHGEAFGPKSAFRYVRLTFPAGTASQWSRIDAQGIAFPVDYLGSFESSDPLLNRIWETGAYTAHLCMQEGIWDAPKRDRGRWMGDLDVTGRVISSVFANRELMEQTMTEVIGDSPVTRDVNTIAGYSALWITGQADFYRHSGDLAYLRSVHPQMLELLRVMDAELDADGVFANPQKHKVFVDWSDGFSADTPDARIATHMEFYLAYQEAAYLLAEIGDPENASAYRAKAEHLRLAAQQKLLDPATNTFGNRWQSNAMAVVAGAATPTQQQAIWTGVLSHVTAPVGPKTVVTPYYGFYMLDAMARLDHRSDALTWMRQYWGGMIAEGATSFWEAYDPRWPKQNFHAYLEADGKRGYYTSLAHGWASGPTAWLMQQILGIQPTAAGFRAVTIRPDLAGLAWAHGAEPTPRGLIRVAADAGSIKVSIPPATVAKLILPFASGQGTILQNGRAVKAVAAEDGTRSVITLQHAGEFTFTQKGRAK